MGRLQGCGDRAGGTWRHEDEDEDIENEDTEEEEDEGVYESVSTCEENFLTGERAAGFADEDEYLEWISRRAGLLCVIKSGTSTIELHGDGQGGVLVRGSWEGPEGPFPVADALRHLAGAGVFAAGADFELTMNGGPIFPGRDSGWAVLARIGPLYAAIEVFDGETECKKIDARTDQAAVAAFIANYTALESTRDRYRPFSPAPENDRPTDMWAPGHP